MKMKQGMKIKQGIKRKLALLLSGVLLMQTVFTGATGGAQTAESITGTSKPITGTPKEAFDELTIDIGGQVGSDNSFGFKVEGLLNDAYRQNIYLAALDDELVLDEADWDQEKETGGQKEYATYDDYLNAQEALEEIGFTVNFAFSEDTGTLEIVAGEALTGDIVGTLVDNGKKTTVVIGHYTVEATKTGNVQNSVFTATFDKMLYDKISVDFGENVFISINGIYESGTTVTAKPGGSGNDFIVEINQDGKTEDKDNPYAIFKNGVVDDSNREIVYTITAGPNTDRNLLAATRSDADLATDDSVSSKSSLSKRKAKKAKAASKEEIDEYLDPEDDENWEDAGVDPNGPGIFTNLIDRLVPGQYDLQVASRAELLANFDLAGLVITDAIPADLVLTKVEKKIAGTTIDDDFVPISKTEGGYTIDDKGVLRYKIPAGNGVVTLAELRITVRLSDQLYNDYLLANKDASWTFTNKAFLRGENDTVKAVSNSVTNTISLLTPFSKDGEAIKSSQGKVAWTLDIKSSFSNSNVVFYAIDHITDVTNTHEYIDPVTISGDDGSKNIIDITPLAGIAANAGYAYGDLTLAKIAELLEAYNSDLVTDGFPPTDGGPYMYKYDTGEFTVKGEPIYDAIMLIPLSTHINRDIQVTYETQMTKGLSGLNTPMDLENEARLLWQWKGGGEPGPGDEPFGNATINKPVQMEYTLVDKKGTQVPGTNIITWTFEVNQFGAEIEELLITDELKKDVQSLRSPEIGEGKELVLTPVKDSVGTPPSVKYCAPDDIKDLPTGTPYYTLDEKTGAEPVLKVFLGKVSKEQNYTFEVKTYVNKLEDNGSGTKTTVENIAKITGKIDGTPREYEAPAQCDVENTLIQKKPVDFEKGRNYDYDENKIKWQIKINPNGWTIKNPVITDKLPEGTHFTGLTMASKADKTLDFTPENEVSGGMPPSDTTPPTEVWTVSDSDGDLQVKVTQAATSDQLTFTFANANSSNTKDVVIDKPYTFEFTTYVEEEYRKENFKITAPTTFLNEAVLTGYLDGAESQFTAKDTATNKVIPKTVTKSGQYYGLPETHIELPDGNNGTMQASGMKWIVYVNRTKNNIEGAIVSDSFTDENNYMELFPSTMKVSTVELDAAGKEKAGTTAKEIYPRTGTAGATTAEMTKNDFEGFSYTIPARYASNTLKFEFTTVMVDDAYVKDMKNQVSLEFAGETDVTEWVDAKDEKDFHIASYANAQGMYFTKIYKTSIQENPRWPLKGAKFKIVELAAPEDSERKDVTKWKQVQDGLLKTRVSNKRGSVSFMFLKADTMYEITETTPPAGYMKTDFKWYVVPKQETQGLSYPDRPTESSSAQYDVLLNTEGKNYHVVTIKNTPLGGTGGSGGFQFKKLGHGDQLLKGAKFELRKGGLSLDEKESDSSGVVNFDVVTPLNNKDDYYTLVETSVPKGYIASDLSKVKVHVYYDKDANANITTVEGLDEESDGSYILKNVPITQSGTFTKKDQNGVIIKDVVKFLVERKGHGGTLVAGMPQVVVDPVDQQGSWNSYIPNPELSSSEGTITFTDFIYGDYKLIETKGPTGMIPVSDSTKVYLRINANGAYASQTEFTGDVDSTNDADITPDGDDTSASRIKKLSKTDATKFTVTNGMQYGLIQVNKVVGEATSAADGTLEALKKETTNITIENATFKIYQDDGDGTYETESDKEFLTLKTNASGNFVPNADKSYTADNKFLTIGRYFLKEVSVEGGYDVVSDKAIPFEIKAKPGVSGEVFIPDQIYIGFDGRDGTSTTDPITGNAEGILFLNEPSRGTIMLSKVDFDYPSQLLSGAEFKICTKNGDIHVANLSEDSSAGNPGKYKLVPLTGSPVKDSIGRDYLMQNGTSGDYELLYGAYCVKETELPSADYAQSNLDTVLDITIGSSPLDRTVKNTIIKHPVQIQKLVEKRNPNGNQTTSAGYDDGEGFTFELWGQQGHSTYTGPQKMLDSGAEFKVEATSGADGIVQFKFGTGTNPKGDIPIGVYRLTETGWPLKYGPPSDPWVKKMPEIKVTVTAAGVTFIAADDAALNTEPNFEVIKQNGTTVSENGTTKAKLIARNTWELGGAHGTKVGVLSANDSVSTNAAFLNGAEFTLTSKADPDLKVVAASDNSGKFTFTNIPYGKYTLTETKTPAGYQTITAIDDVTIDSKSPDTLIKNTAAASGDKIENVLLQKTVKFAKVDQNGAPLKWSDVNVKFTVERADPTPTAPSYTLPGNYKSEQPDVQIGEAGYVILTELAYGVYTLTETTPNSVLEGGEVTITVEPGAAGNTKVTIESDNGKPQSQTIEQSNSIAEFNFASGDESNRFELKNKIRYGWIQINKTLGEAIPGSADGKLEIAGDTKKIPLENVTFKVYQDVDKDSQYQQGTDKEFLTLKTNASGNFVQNTGSGEDAGSYTDSVTGDKKFLTLGQYFLIEQSEAGYNVKNTAIPFTIANADSDFSAKTVYLSFDGSTWGSPVTDPSPADAEKLLFLNEPLRGTLTLKKKDADTDIELSGAEFDVYTEGTGTKVAVLKEKAVGSKSYELLPLGEPAFDDADRKYLAETAVSGTYALLYGEYYLKETKAPEDYELPSDATKYSFTIDKAGVDTLKDGSPAVSNTVYNHNIQIAKMLERLKVNYTDGKAETVFEDYRLTGGFKFKLKNAAGGGPINGTAYQQESTTDTEGNARFENVPAGTYILTEEGDAPEAYMGRLERMKPILVTVTKEGVTFAYESTGAAAIPETSPKGRGAESVTDNGSENAKLTVRNNYLPGSAVGVKKGVLPDGSGTRVNLKGAKFKLVGNNEPKLEIELESGTDGKLEFTGLPYGEYTLTELVPKDGYALNGTPSISFTLDESHTAIKLTNPDTAAEGTIENVPVVKSLQFMKVDQNGEDLGNSRVPVKFKIEKTDSTPSPVPLPADISTDASGVVLINNLTYGTYRLTEENPSGSLLEDNSAVVVSITIGKDSTQAGYTKITLESTDAYGPVKTYSDSKANDDASVYDFTGGFKIANSLRHGDIRINKQLGEFNADGTIKDMHKPLPGVKFEIYRKQGANGWETAPFVTLTTDTDGIITGNAGKYGAEEKELLTGSYKLVEVNPLGGYRVVQPVEFEIRENVITEFVHDGKETPTVNYISAGQTTTGKFYNILESGTVKGKKYTKDMTTDRLGLKGAAFTLTPTSYTGPVRTAVSNSQGEFTFVEVPVGTYDLRETDAPEGYIKSTVVLAVAVTADKEVVIKDTAGKDIELFNEAAADLIIEKQAQVIENNSPTGTMKPGAGFTFKITGTSLSGAALESFLKSTDITGADNIVIRENAGADSGVYATTREAGRIVLNNLPVGEYKVQEQLNDKTNETGAYLPDEKEHTGDITIDQATGKVSEPTVKVENYLKRGQIEGLKTTADKTTPLAGAVIGLFPSTTTAFTEENLWCGQKVTTGEDGKYLFQKVPYGTYLVAELTAPSGYNLNTTTRYEVTVADDKTVKTTGFLLEGEQPKAAAESPILIANTKKSSGGGGGGGGGGGTKPQEPTGPGPGTPTTSPNETSPVNPGESVPGPTNPGETTPDSPLPTLPVETAPGGGNEVIIPPETPPGSDIEIKNPNGDTVYTGKVDENGRVHVELPPGTYTIVTFDENQVPLGSMTFTIEDPFTPLAALAAPDAGDHSVPIVVLAVLMMISLAGMILVARKKKGDKQNPSGKE